MGDGRGCRAPEAMGDGVWDGLSACRAPEAMAAAAAASAACWEPNRVRTRGIGAGVRRGAMASGSAWSEGHQRQWQRPQHVRNDTKSHGIYRMVVELPNTMVVGLPWTIVSASAWS